MPRKFKAALVQMDVGPDIHDNLERAYGLCRKARGRGGDILCLPELFSYMGHFHDPRELALTIGRRSLDALKAMASDFRSYIVGGSVLEPQRRGLPRNTCYFVSPKGKIVSKYSKIHPFDIHVPGKIRFEESKYTQAGKTVSLADTPFGKIGFAICNDIRYPEIFRRLVLAGAETIFITAAFTKFTGREHWIALNKVRAVENQCFIVSVNQSGKNIDGVRFFGSSLACDPWGNVIAEAPGKGDAVIIVDIETSMLKRIRRELPALKKIRKSYPVKCYPKS